MKPHRLEIITKGAINPVELDDVKQFCRIDGDEDDILISAFLDSAREYVESYTSRTLTKNTWKASLDCFPSSRIIVIKKSPLNSIISIKYKDKDNIQQTFDLTKITVDKDELMYSRIVLNNGECWEETINNINAVEIEFEAGFEANSDNPPPKSLSTAIMYLTNNFYENRDSVTALKMNEVPFTLKVLLDSQSLRHV